MFIRTPALWRRVLRSVGHTQPDVVTFCKQHGIVVEAYSPLATGRILDDMDERGWIAGRVASGRLNPPPIADV